MRRVSYLAIAGALALSACGGHAGSPLPSTPSSPTQKQSAPVAFTMHWPSTGVTAGRRPHFVSPSTMSVVVEINNDATLTTIANNPGGGSSTLSLQAPVGNDDFIISLYDQAQTPGETTPVGNELGQVELVQKIQSGQTNTVSATVNGIAAKITMTPLPNQPFIQTVGTASAPHFAIIGQNNAAFSITALDADGNAIVGTGITPTVGLHAAVGTKNFNILSSDTDASRFTVVPTAANSSGTATLIAQATDALGDAISVNVPVDEVGEVYVSYPGASGSKIVAYDTSGNVIPLADNAFAGLQNPVAMAYDYGNSQILVADSGLGEVLAFDSQGNPKAGFTPVAMPNVNAVAVDSFREWMYAGNDTNAVLALAKNGSALVDPAVISPLTLTGGAGAVYFPDAPNAWVGDEYLSGNTSAQELDVYTGYGAPTINWPPSYSLSPAGTPASLATDGNAVYVSGNVSGTGTLWEIPLDSGVYASISDANGPAGIACDPVSGDVFVVDTTSNAISAYKPGLTADSSHTFATPAASGLTLPQGITIAY